MAKKSIKKEVAGSAPEDKVNPPIPIPVPVEDQLKDAKEQLKDIEVPEHLEELKEATDEFIDELIENAPDSGKIEIDTKLTGPIEVKPKSKGRWFRGKFRKDL